MFNITVFKFLTKADKKPNEVRKIFPLLTENSDLDLE